MASLPNDNPLSGHVIVCGLGHVGHRMLCLLARLGEPAVVITREAGDEWRLPAQPHFLVLPGDARDEELLRQAGIERAKAILVVTDDDLANLSIALDARRINPQIIIVMRLFDQGLAAHLEQSATVNRALSTSALAAPAFAAAALGTTVHGRFEAGGTCWIIEECPADASPDATEDTIGPWAAHRDCAVLALQKGAETVLRPAGATRLLPGDRLTVLRAAGSRGTPAPRCRECEGSGPKISALRALGVGVREWWREVPAALRTALFGLLAVVLLSIGVFHFALGLSLVDSFYFVITTITTVGYGDYSLKDAPASMKLYGAFVMLCGAAILAVLFSIVTDLILRTRLRDLIARGCAGCQGHIIVAGLGSIGFRLARDLARSGETVVAIERQEDGEFVQAARELAPVVLGNAKTEETLRKAGVAGAKALVAATDDDLANLSIALATKRSRASCRVVLRIFDSALAEKMQRGLPIDAVLSVSAAAAPTLVGSVLCPDLLQGILLENHLVLIFCRRMDIVAAETRPEPTPGAPSEFALFVKPAGAAAFEPVTAESTLRAGDQVIGARCYPLKKRQADP